MFNWKRATEVACCVALFAGCASMGAGKSPAEIVKERQSGMQAIAKANGALKGQLSAATPNVEGIKAAATTLAASFDNIHQWWPDSTSGEPTAKSQPAVFTDKAGFKKQIDGVRAASQKLGRAAKGNDVAAIKVAADEVGGYCGSCHRPYRILPAKK